MRRRIVFDIFADMGESGYVRAALYGAAAAVLLLPFVGVHAVQTLMIAWGCAVVMWGALRGEP